MFVMGACGIIYEYVLSVVANYLIGSNFEEMFLIIGMMMFAMGLGSMMQQRLEKNLVDRFLLIEIVLGLVGGAAPMVVYGIFAVSESFSVFLYFFAINIGVLIGMEIPILIRINKEYVKQLRINLSEILSMDYVGSLVGAILFVYVLLTHVTIARIGFILGLFNIAIAIVGLVVFRTVVKRPRVLTFAAAAAATILGIGVINADDWSAAAEQRYLKDPIVFRETTQYQNIILTRRADGLIRLFLNRHLQFCSADEKIYHELLVHPAMSMAPSRASVLILGGGDGLALREVLRYDDVESVTLVDIDPAMVRFASTEPHMVRINHNAFGDARVRHVTGPVESDGEKQQVGLVGLRRTQLNHLEFHPTAEVDVATLDAAAFLPDAAGSFDVAFLDFPDPSSVPLAKLFSKDMYLELRRKLKPGAIIAVQSTSPFQAKNVFLCIGETLRAAGFAAVPYHHVVPSMSEWGFHLASIGAEESVLLDKMRNIDNLIDTTEFVTPEVIASSTVFGKGWLTPDFQIEPNSKMHPVILQYFRHAWRML